MFFLSFFSKLLYYRQFTADFPVGFPYNLQLAKFPYRRGIPLRVAALTTSVEARNDVTNPAADPFRVCTEKNNMASKFEKFANFDERFLLY